MLGLRAWRAGGKGSWGRLIGVEVLGRSLGGKELVGVIGVGFEGCWSGWLSGIAWVESGWDGTLGNLSGMGGINGMVGESWEA